MWTSCLAVALLASPAVAVEPNTHVELRLSGTPMAGAGYLGGDGHGKDASGPSIGGEVGAFRVVASWLSVGVTAGYRRYLDADEADVPADAARDDGSLNVLTVVPTLRVGRTDGERWRFFGELGLGYAYLRPDDPGADAVMHTFEARLGGGVTVPITQAIAVQGHVGVAYGAGEADASGTDDPHGYTDGVLVMQGRMLDLGVGLSYRF